MKVKAWNSEKIMYGRRVTVSVVRTISLGSSLRTRDGFPGGPPINGEQKVLDILHKSDDGSATMFSQ